VQSVLFGIGHKFVLWINKVIPIITCIRIINFVLSFYMFRFLCCCSVEQMLIKALIFFTSALLLLSSGGASVIVFQRLELPKVVYGTAWKAEHTKRLVTQALQVGYRAIDTACQPKHYNEKGVGKGILIHGLHYCYFTLIC
jgi:hypothetical protein